MPQGEPIQKFCLKNKVPYNLFHKWYKDTRHQIVPVQVKGLQEQKANCRKEVPSSLIQERQGDTEPQPVKITETVGKLRSKLNTLTAGNHHLRGELIEKAVNYLENFWKQLFNYLKDGWYSIDNSIAERFIRLLAEERKNSLWFGNNHMANTSAAYHTLIATCQMNGMSVLDYFKKFFWEIVSGRRNYENLLSMTIGININYI